MKITDIYENISKNTWKSKLWRIEYRIRDFFKSVWEYFLGVLFIIYLCFYPEDSP